MNSNSFVTPAERRSWNYWNEDGLANMVTGAGCLSIAALNLVSVYLAGEAARFWAIGILLIAYMILTLYMRAVVVRLKERLVYPRTGYVAPPYFTESYPPQEPPTTLSIFDDVSSREVERARWDRSGRSVIYIVLMTMLAVCVTLVANLVLCIAAGALTGLLLVFVSRWDARLSWAMVFGFPFAGAMMLNMVLRGPGRYSAWLLGAGLLLTLYGAIRLSRYLRANPMGSMRKTSGAL